ncbi:MAG TPA: hypothetical protein VK745_13550 [Polyangiaceae bacterium]|jgi:hypothetical protein|nr:hypothetical protein [Polyangiaceae bacterium]
MKITKLFQVLVVTGASSTVGLAACGSDTTPSGGSAGATSAAGSSSTAGATGDGGPDMCAAVCGPSPCGHGFIDCAGCCCWITAPATGICTEEGCPADDACCVGR